MASTHIRTVAPYLFLALLALGSISAAGPTAPTDSAKMVAPRKAAKKPVTREDIILVLVDLCGQDPIKSAKAFRRLKEIGVPAIRLGLERIGPGKRAEIILPLIIEMQNTKGIQPVHENGLEFLVVTDLVWGVPAPGKATPVNLTVKITSHGKTAVYLPLCLAFWPKLMTATYDDAKPIGGGNDSLAWGRRTPALSKGESFTETIRAALCRSKDGKKMWVSFEHCGFWTLLEIPKPGLYFLELKIVSQSEWPLGPGAREWRGRVTNLPIAVVIE